MHSSKQQKGALRGYLYGLLIIVFIIASGGKAQAYNYLLQDSTKKMSGMEKGSGNMMHHGSMSGMKSDMQKMHKNMTGMKMTGNPDYDFASMMIRHHEGAINMSKKEVNKGKDSEVKSMAKKIIDDQGKEVKELRAFVKKNKPSKTNSAGKQEETGSADKSMTDNMNKMMKDMQDIKMTGNQDQDYVSMMIVHHQHSVDMAKDYMDKAKDDNLKKMAQKMIDENNDQISKLKDWQDKHK